MMKKIRDWLLNKFLPTWAKDSVYLENETLKAELKQKDITIAQLNAYIDGLERGIRAQRRIVINNTTKEASK